MVRNKTDVDDLLQEIWFKVWRHFASFRSECGFRTWITRVAINEALQSYRRSRLRPICQTLREIDALATSNESPLQSLARAETTRVVRHAVSRLPANYRQVLILREFRQLTSREMADSLQSSIPAVKARLFRARVMLRNFLQQPGSAVGRAEY